MDNIHEGHRERLREKVRKFGFATLADHEKIEYLLYPFIPRRDTNPIAHDLVAKFGSFSRVLEANEDALMSVKGMSQNAALFLSSLPKIGADYYKNVASRRIWITLTRRQSSFPRISAEKKQSASYRYIWMKKGIS